VDNQDFIRSWPFPILWGLIVLVYFLCYLHYSWFRGVGLWISHPVIWCIFHLQRNWIVECFNILLQAISLSSDINQKTFSDNAMILYLFLLALNYWQGVGTLNKIKSHPFLCLINWFEQCLPLKHKNFTSFSPGAFFSFRAFDPYNWRHRGNLELVKRYLHTLSYFFDFHRWNHYFLSTLSALISRPTNNPLKHINNINKMSNKFLILSELESKVNPEMFGLQK
jgi:hypothetical protein